MKYEIEPKYKVGKVFYDVYRVTDIEVKEAFIRRYEVSEIEIFLNKELNILEVEYKIGCFKTESEIENSIKNRRFFENEDDAIARFKELTKEMLSEVK